MFPSTTLTKEKCENIGGWLILFILSLMLVPLSSLYVSFMWHTQLSEYFTTDQSILYWYSINTIFNILISATAIYALVLIFRKKENSAKFSKFHLTILLLTSLSMLAIPKVLGMDEETTSYFNSYSTQNAFRKIVYFIIWFWYLSTSSRVKLTFSKEKN